MVTAIWHKEKCIFLQTFVKYLRYIVDANEVHTSAAKLEAIQKAPDPYNVSELQKHFQATKLLYKIPF